MSEEKIRRMVREVIDNILDDVSSEGVVTTMDDYDDKDVFRGKSNKNKERAKDIAKSVKGTELTDRGKKNIKKDPEIPTKDGHDKWWSDDTNEISTTAGVAGFETPKAFNSGSADHDDDEGIKKKLKMDEARTRYHKLKYDQSRTAKQKIGQSIRDAKKAVREAKKTIRVIAKYKNEFGLSHENYWKTTQKDIYKMEADLHAISQKLRELRS